MRDASVNEQITVFRVGPVVCSVAARLVDSVVSPQALHQFPHQADFIVGVLEYGKKAVSIVNLFHKFNLPEPNAGSDSRYLMGIASNGVYGFWVDEILEVTDEYEIHDAETPTFSNVNIFDATYLWRDKLVLNTDFERLFNMNESIPIQGWIDAGSVNAIASTYPDSTIEHSDIVAWSEPVDQVSKQRIKDLVTRGVELSHSIVIEEEAVSDSTNMIDEENSRVEDSDRVQNQGDTESITVSPLTEINVHTVIVPEPPTESGFERKQKSDGDLSTSQESQIENEILASLASSHGDIKVSEKILPVEEVLDESLHQLSSDKVSSVTPTIESTFKENILSDEQERSDINQDSTQTLIDRDFLKVTEKESDVTEKKLTVEERLDSIVRSIDLLEEHDSQQLKLDLESNLIPVEARSGDDILAADGESKVEAEAGEDVTNSFKEKIKNKIVIYPSSAHYVNMPDAENSESPKSVPISKSFHSSSRALPGEQASETVQMEDVSSLILGDEKTKYKVVREKIVTQERALDRVVHRIIEKRDNKNPTSRFRLPFAILVSAIIVFYIQHYWLNPSIDDDKNIPTLQLLQKNPDKVTGEEKSSTAIGSFPDK